MTLLPQPTHASAALVLRAWPAGETSVVASVLTEASGFVRLIAKGARTGRSTLGPLVQPGRLVEIEYGQDPRRELQYLKGGRVVLDPLLESTSLERMAYLLAALEIVDRCRPDGEGGGGLFELCRRWVSVLSSAPAGAEAPLFYALELTLLDLQGLAPVLHACTHCGADSAGQEGLRFSAEDGGVVCRRCVGADGVKAGRSLSREAVAALLATSADTGPPLLDAGLRRELGIHLHLFMAHHLPAYRLPAGLELLRAARGAAAPAAGDDGEDDPT
jgi:DNA repair protein RecO (recombination protein O)